MIERSDINNLVTTRASWGAIFAGFVTVIAVQITLSLLGIGIGLGSLGVAGTGAAQGVGIGSLIWMVVTSIIAFFTGSWVAGRLSGVQLPSSAALHGILVWGLTSLVTLFLLTSAVGSLIGGAFSMIGQAAGPAAQQMAGQQQGQQGGQASTQAGMGAPMPQQMPSEVGTMLNKIVTQGPDSVSPQERESAINALSGSGQMNRDQAESTINRMIEGARNVQQKSGEAAKAGGVAGISGFVMMALTALFSAWGAAAGRVKAPIQA